MFHYLSGFASDLDLDQVAEVYVYLLFPQRFRDHLKAGFFNHSKFIKKRSGNINHGSVTQNGFGSAYEHYVPFALPFKATFVRDTGVYINRDENCAVIEWLEKHFDVNLDDYLGELSERSYIEPTGEINESNLFDYLAVAFEHQSFADHVFEALKNDDDLMMGIKYVSPFYEVHDVTIMQQFASGKNLSLIEGKHSQSELLNIIETYQQECDRNIVELFPSVRSFAAMTLFLNNNNRPFKPCSMGSQRYSTKYIDLMDAARKQTKDQLFASQEITE